VKRFGKNRTLASAGKGYTRSDPTNKVIDLLTYLLTYVLTDLLAD